MAESRRKYASRAFRDQAYYGKFYVGCTWVQHMGDDKVSTYSSGFCNEAFIDKFHDIPIQEPADSRPKPAFYCFG